MTPPILVGLTGPIGAGKSTAARILVERHGFKRLPFAAPLKTMLRTLLTLQGASAAEADAMVDGTAKEVPTPLLGGATPRRAMQTLGTEWGRALAGDLWVAAWRRAAAGHARVVADDVRFANEAAVIRAFDGLVVAIERPGAGGGHGHVSERGLAADRLVVNDGDVPLLAQRIVGLLA